MNHKFDILQIPDALEIEDLPQNIQINTPFEIEDNKYVIILGNKQDLEVCEASETTTTIPALSSNYYILKKHI